MIFFRFEMLYIIVNNLEKAETRPQVRVPKHEQPEIDGNATASERANLRG